MRASSALALLLLSLALAGCSDGKTAPPPPAGPAVEGWVVDSIRAPVADATVQVEGLGLNATTDDEGHFSLAAPPGVDLLVIVSAEGFLVESQLVPAFSGAYHVLNFTLARVPDATPYHTTTDFRGTVPCGVTLVLQEDPNNPHQHQGVRCSEVVPTEANVWNYTIPADATGLVLEGSWEAQTPASEALVIKAEVAGTDQVLAFLETSSPLRIQLGSANLAQAAEGGRTFITVTVTPGAGTGSHEHGAVGLFVEQEFRLFMTAFFNGPVDSAFSVTRGQ